MADSWFTLSREDQAEALEVAAAQTGRPPHLLEKDPDGHALEELEKDYAAMLEDGLLSTHQPSFDEVIFACTQFQNRINNRPEK